MFDCTDTTFCIPAVPGLPRSKGLIIKQERVLDYSINSKSKNPAFQDANGEVRRNKRWQFKLRMPVMNKEHLKLAVGIKYFQEEYSFSEFSDATHPLLRNLEDRPLRSLGGVVYAVKPFLGNHYLLFRGSANLNGDYGSDQKPKGDFLKYSVAPLYGVKKNINVSYAFGVALTYNFGRTILYPVFAYNKTFNPKWGIETFLPVNARLRYTPNDKNVFYASTSLHGSNYNIHFQDTALQRQETLYLQKSEIRYMLTYEREIHDWLWIGFEGGMRSNLEFSLSDSYTRNRNVLIDSQLKDAFLFNISLFVVAPRKFLR